MMTIRERLDCIKKINPLAKCVVWQDRGGKQWVVWDDAHEGVKPTLEECEAVLKDVQSGIASEKAVDEAKTKLADIDLKSIRAMREWIAKQADAPQFIKDYEAQVTTERAKLK